MNDNNPHLYKNSFWKFDLEAIVFYDKKNTNKIIWDIKDLKKQLNIIDKNIYINNLYIKEFKKILEEMMLNIKNKGLNPVLLFPPTKPNKNNQVIKLLEIIKFDFYGVDYIELKTKLDFELKQYKTILERKNFLKTNYQDFEMILSNESIRNKNNNHFLFIDDIVVNGIFMYYCIKKISESLNDQIISMDNISASGLFIAKTREKDSKYCNTFKTILIDEWID